MSDYRVNLDIFAGPLDLLLYLVRKEEVDIYDIPIAKITDQYLQYIEILKNLDIDLAGDFLVMAATLMQIKSAMLLPKAETDKLGDEDLSDPRTELIRQLLEYKKFKDAANMLNAVADEHLDRFSRPDTIIEQFKTEPEPEVDLEQVTIWDLLEAFDSVCKAIGNQPDISQIKDDTPIDLYQIEILHRLQTEGPQVFQRIFESCVKAAYGDVRRQRVVIVAHFLAILELIREKLICLEQPIPATIYLRSLTDEPAEQAVRNAIFTSEAERESRMETQDEEFSDQPVPIVAVDSQDHEQDTSDEISELDMEDEEDLEIRHELSEIDEPQETYEVNDEQKTFSSEKSQITDDETSQKPPIAISELPPQKTATTDEEVKKPGSSVSGDE
ncbi:MAG: segregation/condensation protein A [Sedimentisphaerales bacterium]|nr:segregation/condensation protein A [Sedimentisphaerales bacterium]